MTFFEKLEQQLLQTFSDRNLDAQEKFTLFDIFQPLNREQRAFVRNKAFSWVRQHSHTEPVEPLLKWLEAVVKMLDASRPGTVESEVFFSPGRACRDALLGMIARATVSLDICVFTISDDAICAGLLQAHQRGVHIRVISDNDKQYDHGNDIAYLQRQGFQVRVDDTRHHMHHKFMVVDGARLVTGSFNWTLSASRYNHENIVSTNSPAVVADFIAEFNRLWQAFA